MDDQLAKHIKEMLRKIRQKPTEQQERPRKPDTINQIARMLRRVPDYPYDPRPSTHPSWRNADPKI
jgi:hypothetical protein